MSGRLTRLLVRLQQCKHRNADHCGPQNSYLSGCYHRFEYFVCLDCGAWLSLGPANDEPEAVQIEIRAAELADAETIWTPEAIGGGYVAACWKPGEHFSDKIRDAEEWAGYLARCITHETENV